MNVDLARIVDSFAGLEILVIGDAILDVYLQGTTGRLCREAPIPVVDVSERRRVPGGAANTAANVRALGGRSRLLSVVGDDHEGLALCQELNRFEIVTDSVLIQPGRMTPAKHRLVGSRQMLARFDQGDARPLSVSLETQLASRIEELVPTADAIIVSDYGYGVVCQRLIERLAKLRLKRPTLLVADSPNLRALSSVRPTVVKPSYNEALRLLGLEPDAQQVARSDLIASHATQLLEATASPIAAVTMDVDGVIVLEQGRPPYRTYARPGRPSHSTGGGDTFISTLALALAAGADTAAAAELASAAASVVVGKEGTATCSDHELRDFISGEEKRIADLGTLRGRLDFYRGQGKRIVFTNGCFDILHRGHVGFLNRAKGLGDILIVGVNSDRSVSRLKGPERPINALEDRIKVLAALSYVDHIVPFEGDTPSDLIRTIRPDILAKGGDYTRETLPEAPLVERLGGAVCVLPFLEERSTSGIIERIQRTANTDDR